MTGSYLYFILLLPLVGFLINGTIALQKARGRGVVGVPVIALIGCLMPALSFVLCAVHFCALAGGTTSLTQWLGEWMVVSAPFADFDLVFDFGLHFDKLSGLMTLIITGVGSLIHVYSIGYMREDEGFAKYMSYLNLFLFFMLVLVLADSLIFLFVGWEGVGLCSYLLIGFWFTDEAKAKAGKKAFIVNRVGDFAFLIGLFLIVTHFAASFGGETARPVLNFSFLLSHISVLGPVLPWVALCFFIAATGKSAQIPLYVWLPDAMAGPTPVSALIHAATMVTAGIYLIARLSAVFVLAPVVMNIVAVIGATTALMAALIAITQYDIKKVLAYSTVSQLGYMFLALGVGAFSGAIFHVMTHAFFKACLFLGSGSVIHSLHHEQDIRKMGGLFKKMPITAWTFLISTLAIAGVPGLSGFFSKDEILYMTFAGGHKILWGMALFTAALTAFYMMRLFVYTFLGKTRYAHPEQIHESPRVMTVPLLVLAALAVVAGYLGLPHILGHSWIGDWLGFLGQVTPHHIEGSALQEGHLMLISSGVAILSLAFAWAMYRKNLKWTHRLKISFSCLYQTFVNKFKVDEIYEAVIVKPIRKFSDVILFQSLDVKIVDGLFVHGATRFSDFVAKTLAAAQTGSVGHYLIYFLTGLILVIAFVTLY